MVSSGTPPLFDLILDRCGELDTERIEAIDADAAWRQGLMLHLAALKGVVQLDASDQPRPGPLDVKVLILSQGWTGGSCCGGVGDGRFPEFTLVSFRGGARVVSAVEP